MNLRIALFSIFLSVTACSSNPEKIVIEDKAGIPVANISAFVETPPVISKGDAADDPAIWYNTKSPENSVILGTNKQSSLLAYSLEGNQVQELKVGRVNNVDIRDIKNGNSKYQSIAAASNRTDNTLSMFAISDKGSLTLLGDHALTLPEPYGTCMYRDVNDNLNIFVNDKNGQYQQWRIDTVMPLGLSLVREFSISTQPEGCAAHDASGTLFIGEEEYGVWKLNLNVPDSTPELLTTVNDGVLVADVEGMDIYLGESTNYLVVSSQGDNSYAIYDIGLKATDFVYKGSFRIIPNEQNGIDGTQETDGISVSSANFGPTLPHGFIAIQDGFNRKPKEEQNFKFVSWELIAEALQLSY